MPLRTRLALLTAGLTAATCLTAVGPAHAHTSQPSHACSPSVSIDRFSDALDKTTYEDTFVGNISALAVDSDGSLAALSDRSSLFRLDARTLKPRSVVPLTDETGAALDSEGLVVDRDGTRLVTSETEPSIRRYSRTGTILDRLPVPDDLRVTPAGRARPNGTFEGLTLLPGGRTLVASMEYPLSGDSADTVRFQTWDRHRGHFRLGRQYAYRTDPALGVSEIQATPDGRLLVLERGFTSGVGNTVRLYLADPRHAMRKTLLTDLATCPTLGATAKQPQPNPLLDNIEAMTITGRTKNTLKVLLASDDNQNPTQTTRFYYLRVRATPFL
ncbi:MULTISPECIES: esterase-like activity of phytase family protein [Streptomyces]|uniref:Esterase-like activity of phytase family protein n=1 Tax=Streptomyces koelreuteriae TaxID=2838015 RepID=A0ABX8FW29_9ACTN|nr:MULTISPECIES: esterase-like activity of phytase family protein [Streptomyces]QWB25420.1 esterase-like activity of phytase family protein [Streptomyces koelreuteriae]UUA08464.1 esterase-like activity of phytase family protein [Streptomyces koelreuteriae]UUA16069.1 esterase-like activity of phytase family protein [Streptomyces sp. CRCS-T-1]